MKVDPQSLATGYRTSKVVGSTVVNEANEAVGTIDDLIVTPNEKVPFAVLSVGGFLGMGTKYVVVPFSALQVKDKKMVLHGRHQRLAEEPSGVQIQHCRLTNPEAGWASPRSRGINTGKDIGYGRALG